MISDISNRDPKLPKMMDYIVTQIDPEQEVNVIIAIGSNQLRQKISLEKSNHFVKVIYLRANVSSRCSILEGTVVMAGATINSGSFIGKHCIINTNSVIEHDCLLANFVHVSSGASIAGNVSVGEGSHLGIGCSVIPDIKTGKWAIIGAGVLLLSMCQILQ